MRIAVDNLWTVGGIRRFKFILTPSRMLVVRLIAHTGTTLKTDV